MLEQWLVQLLHKTTAALKNSTRPKTSPSQEAMAIWWTACNTKLPKNILKYASAARHLILLLNMKMLIVGVHFKRCNKHDKKSQWFFVHRQCFDYVHWIFPPEALRLTLHSLSPIILKPFFGVHAKYDTLWQCVYSVFESFEDNAARE